MKKWSFILSMILSFNAYAEIMSGTCGEDCHWKIDENRALTIEGEGNMDDYQDKEDSPWYEERNRVSKIIISEGITNIGAKAFYGANPGSITIPNSVESIGDKAFYGLVARAQIYCQNTENRRCDTLINRKTEGQDRLVLYEIKGDRYVLDGKQYRNLNDMLNNIPVKRIYTVEEANAVAGKVNSVKIRYR